MRARARSLSASDCRPAPPHAAPQDARDASQRAVDILKKVTGVSPLGKRMAAIIRDTLLAYITADDGDAVEHAIFYFIAALCVCRTVTPSAKNSPLWKVEQRFINDIIMPLHPVHPGALRCAMHHLTRMGFFYGLHVDGQCLAYHFKRVSVAMHYELGKAISMLTQPPAVPLVKPASSLRARAPTATLLCVPHHLESEPESTSTTPTISTCASPLTTSATTSRESSLLSAVPLDTAEVPHETHPPSPLPEFALPVLTDISTSPRARLTSCKAAHAKQKKQAGAGWPRHYSTKVATSDSSVSNYILDTDLILLSDPLRSRLIGVTASWCKDAAAAFGSQQSWQPEAVVRNALGAHDAECIQGQLHRKLAKTATAKYDVISTHLKKNKHVMWYRLDLSKHVRACILINFRARIIVVHAIFISGHSNREDEYIPDFTLVEKTCKRER